MNFAAPPRATYQDILSAPDGVIAEIIAGALETQPRPATRHQRALTALSSALFPAYDLGTAGPGGWTILAEPEVHFSPTDIYVPDLAGWRTATMPSFEAAPHIKTVPDWVCEILSPATRRHDLTTKRDTYAAAGVGHLWLIDPDAETLEAFALHSGAWLLSGALAGAADAALPPFAEPSFDLATLWPPGAAAAG